MNDLHSSMESSMHNLRSSMESSMESSMNVLRSLVESQFSTMNMRMDVGVQELKQNMSNINDAVSQVHYTAVHNSMSMSN